MTEAVEVKPGQPLHALLELPEGGGGGVAEIRRLAALSVGDVGAGGASVMGKKVSEWPAADLAQELKKAFPLDPFTLLAKAWGQVRKVRKAIDASRGSPPSSQPVTLIEHEIEAKYEPRLVLEVNGVDWFDVKLGLTLKVMIESAHLELFDGGLRSVSLGKPTGAISLHCQGQEVAAFKRAVNFAPSYEFDPPLRLSRSDADSTA